MILRAEETDCVQFVRDLQKEKVAKAEQKKRKEPRDSPLAFVSTPFTTRLAENYMEKRTSEP